MVRLARLLPLVWLATLIGAARGHDIPNARVDRSIQARVGPQILLVEYEVSLAELTLVQDMRTLAEIPPNLDRRTLYEMYAQITAPLNARGFLVSVDDAELELKPDSLSLKIDDHPRFHFRMKAAIPSSGRLKLQDTNYAASEGTSRLAILTDPGLIIEGDDLPSNVEQIPIRPVWELSDSEEKRTKQVEITYRPAPLPAPVNSPAKVSQVAPEPKIVEPANRFGQRMIGLLDGGWGFSTLGLLAVAVGLGAAHSIQPGHGKSLVAAASLGHDGGRGRALLLASMVTLTHTGVVLAIGVVIWATRTSRYAEIDAALTHVAGFLIAALGAWKVGRWFSGIPEHNESAQLTPLKPEAGRLIGVGIVAGLVPCWDAVTLLVMAEAMGRLGQGVLLVCAFGMGMGLVLASISWAAGRLSPAVRAPRWSRPLPLAAGLVILAMGLYLLSGVGARAA